MYLGCIKSAWQVYHDRKNLRAIIGAQIIYTAIVLGIIAASVVPFIAVGAGSITAGMLTENAPQLAAAAAVFFIGIFIAACVAIVLDTGRIGIYADAIAGRKIRVNTMFRVAGEKFWTSLGSTLLITAIIIPAALILIIPTMALPLNPLTSLLTFIDILVLALFAILFSLNRQAIVLGNHRAVDSVKQSYYVVRRNYLEFLKLVVVFGIIGFVLSLIPVFGMLLILLVMKPVADIAYTIFYMEAVKAKAAVAPVRHAPQKRKKKAKRRARKKKRKR